MRGRARQKKPYRALDDWSQGVAKSAPSGVVGWRRRARPHGHWSRTSPASRKRLRSAPAAERHLPPLAPDVAALALSPNERPRDVAAKVDTYPRAGTALVMVVDGDARTVDLLDVAGSKTVPSPAIVRHDAPFGFELDLAAFFSRALDRRS